MHTKYTSLAEAASMFTLGYISDKGNPRIKATDKVYKHKIIMSKCTDGYEYTYMWLSASNNLVKFVRVRLDTRLFMVTTIIEWEREVSADVAKRINEEIRKKK